MAKQAYRWRRSGRSWEILINTQIYPREPLYATCCVFMDAYYLWLDVSPEKKFYKVVLIPQDGQADQRGKKIPGEFLNELLSNVLRYRIAERNQKVRECIVREALFFAQPREEQEKEIVALSKQDSHAEKRDP